MEIKFKLNGKEIKAEAEADTILLDFLREQGCYSVKRGCETANCGLCTVLMNKKSVLSCSILAVQADECRRKLKNSEIFLQMKAQSSADFAIPALL